jgi:NAD(P)H-dependent FMN reductase
VAAGTRALQQLKPVVSVLKMVPLSEAVNVPFFTQFIGEDGVLAANEVMEQAASAMLDELQRLNGALAPLRSKEAVARA